MTSEFTESINETFRQEFESKWVSERMPVIEEHLPEITDSKYLGTLEELVHIDLEFRWKRFSQDEKQKPPTIESYLERFDALDDVGILTRLVQGEVELMHRFGKDAGSERYEERFPQLADAVDLAGLLAKQQQTMVREVGPVTAGDVLGRYKLIAEHGKGGFGAVWRADDSKLDRRIALKRLSSHLSRQSESRRRFVSEARITAKLEHPGIVPVYDISNLDEDHAYYTMKLVRGLTMAQAIDRTSKLNRNSSERAVEQRRLLTSFVDICHTIQYCHARGVIHRDLKPQNVVMGDYGETIVLDWGLATLVDQEKSARDEQPVGRDDLMLSQEESVETLKGAIQGTPAYMPPEIARGEVEQSGILSDIYSLGAILYHLLTGQVPFTDSDSSTFWDRLKAADLTRPRQLDSDIPPAIEAICLKAMSADATDRYASIDLLLDDVQNYLADEPVTAYAEPWTARASRWIRKHKTLAATGIVTIIFLCVAATISTVIWQQMREKEIARVNQIRNRAERADAMALSQIQSDRFDSALGFLNQAADMVQSEKALDDLSERIDQRRERVTRIVSFYELGERAQEHLFFDQLREATIYAQAALDEVNALDHVDWWNRLPVEDLSPIQIKNLQDEVYRQLGVLSSIRLAEKAEEGFSVEWLSGISSGTDEVAVDEKVLSAMHAARQANRFRPARILQIVHDLGEMFSGERDSVNLMIGSPLNPTDAAMMGSILDTHAPDDAVGKMMVRTFLGGKDPTDTAQQWLLDALTAAPDWYWLSIFIGTNELKSGDFDNSIRSFSHAVGVEPEGWVGYLYRAMAYLGSSQQAARDVQQSADLRRAYQDLQRARDSESDNSYLYWTTGHWQIQTQTHPSTTARTFLEALERHKTVDQIRGGHFGSITQMFLGIVDQYTQAELEKDPTNVDLLLLQAAVEHWRGNADESIKAARNVLEIDQDNSVAKGVLGMALLNTETASAQQEAVQYLVESLATEDAFWASGMDYANYLEEGGQVNEALDAYRNATSIAKTRWQRSLSLIAQTRCLLAIGQEQPAIEAFQKGVNEDLTVDFSSLTDNANSSDFSEFAYVVQRHVDRIQPRTAGLASEDTIDRPALMNGGFELGFSFAWGNEPNSRSKQIWSNEPQCRSSAQVTTQSSHTGHRSLRIVNETDSEVQAAGSMKQVIPVTEGMTYRIRVACKAQDLQDSGFQILAGEDQAVIEAPSGSYEWRILESEFTANADSVDLIIQSSAPGTVWIDDIEIQKSL